MTVPTPEEIRARVAARVAEEEAAHGTGAKEAHGSTRKFALLSAGELCAQGRLA